MKYVASSSRQWKSGRGYVKAQLVTADTLRVPGTLVQVLKVQPKQVIPPHYHEHSTEVFYVLSGSGTMTIAGETVAMHPGDTVVCEPRELHAAENSSTEEWEYVVFKTNWKDGDSVWV